jgi:hypothetical protein
MCEQIAARLTPAPPNLESVLDHIERETGVRPNAYMRGAGFPALEGLVELPTKKRKRVKRKPPRRAKPRKEAK